MNAKARATTKAIFFMITSPLSPYVGLQNWATLSVTGIILLSFSPVQSICAMTVTMAMPVAKTKAKTMATNIFFIGVSLPSVHRTLARHFPNSRSNVWTVYCLYCIKKVDYRSPLRSSVT
jgi:hypothetical protein